MSDEQKVKIIQRLRSERNYTKAMTVGEKNGEKQPA